MKSWLSNMSAGLAGGLLASLVLVGLLAWQSDRIAELTIGANPTCDVPTGLAPIPETDIVSAVGPAMKDPDFASAKAVDGFGGSIWVPPISSIRGHPVPRFIPGKDTLTLRLNRARDVRLVCVVNGLANNYTNYENWGRVRTVSVRGEAGEAQTSIMKSLGPDSFPNAQLAGKRLGLTKTVSIRVIDAFAGQTEESYDPDVCFRNGDRGAPRLPEMTWEPRFAQGCIVNATPKAGLADVFLYEPSP